MLGEHNRRASSSHLLFVVLVDPIISGIAVG